VLVVDDDEPMSRMIAMTLRSSGYTVTTAPDGKSGLEHVETDHPDLIVLDLNMPVMDGRAFYRELRGRGDETPVVIVSANGARSAQRELKAQASISKPFFPEDLAEQVDAVLNPADKR
jgi:DNA-binding response OmpR family regulator